MHWPLHWLSVESKTSLGSPWRLATMNTRWRHWGSPKPAKLITRCAHLYPKFSSSSTTYEIAGSWGCSSARCHFKSPVTFSRRTQGTFRFRKRRKICEHSPVRQPLRSPGRVGFTVLTSYQCAIFEGGFSKQQVGVYVLGQRWHTWHGNPAARSSTSGGKTWIPAMSVTSSRPGNWRWRTCTQCGSRSTCRTTSCPDCSNPKSSPPIPEKRLATFMNPSRQCF